LLAGLIVLTGKGEPLALVGDGFAIPGMIIGTLAFMGLTAMLYRYISSLGRKTI
jgi:hypothetical protein